MLEWGNSVFTALKINELNTKKGVNIRNVLIRDMRDVIVKHKIHNPDVYLFHKINKMGEVILGWYIGDTSTLQKRIRKEKLIVDVHLRVRTPDTNIVKIPYLM